MRCGSVRRVGVRDILNIIPLTTHMLYLYTAHAIDALCVAEEVRCGL